MSNETDDCRKYLFYNLMGTNKTGKSVLAERARPLSELLTARPRKLLSTDYDAKNNIY